MLSSNPFIIGGGANEPDLPLDNVGSAASVLRRIIGDLVLFDRCLVTIGGDGGDAACSNAS
jgi:hypothetical protein